jgi:hypothetical protein
MPITVIAMLLAAALYILWPAPKVELPPTPQPGIFTPHFKSEWEGMVKK